MSPNPHDMIDRYLDGTLAGDDLARFEAALHADPSLRHEIELQSRIDDSLDRLFTPPPSAVVTPPAPAATKPPTPWWKREIPKLPLAAAAAIAAIVYLGFQYFSPTPENPRMNPATVYSNLEVTGWPIEFVCKDEQEFADVMQQKMGVPLYVPAATPGLVVAGWSYTNSYSGTPLGPTTMYLISRVEQQPVLVLIEKSQYDRKIKLPKDSPLHLHRRQVKDVVMYEVSPLEAPRVINVMTEMAR